MRSLITKLTVFLTLVLCMGVFCIPVFAVDEGEEILTVNAAWVEGEMLRINVTDVNGVDSSLALKLKDYVKDVENSEYISIQAVDLAGNKSGIIEIKNPYYNPPSSPIIITPETTEPETTQLSQSAIPDSSKPFTPDGSGTVIDNVTNGDGKEFFSIGTEDGSVFYLIVDRQRNSDNVYFLNAVTLDDLVALAEKNGNTINTGGNTTSAIQTPEQLSTENGQNPPQSTQTEPNTKPTTATSKKNDTGMYILIGIAVIAAGGLGYYFKIVKGRKNNTNADDENDNNDEYGYSDPDEENDDYSGDESEDGGDDE